jgi:hypothetical protein
MLGSRDRAPHDDRWRRTGVALDRDHPLSAVHVRNLRPGTCFAAPGLSVKDLSVHQAEDETGKPTSSEARPRRLPQRVAAVPQVQIASIKADMGLDEGVTTGMCSTGHQRSSASHGLQQHKHRSVSLGARRHSRRDNHGASLMVAEPYRQLHRRSGNRLACSMGHDSNWAHPVRTDRFVSIATPGRQSVSQTSDGIRQVSWSLRHGSRRFGLAMVPVVVRLSWLVHPPVCPRGR